MRVTSETLFKLAKDFVTQRSDEDRTLLGVFLQGSLLQDDPLLGGTTDIDLFLVHSDPPAQEREVVRITDEIHLDIAHHSRSQYRQTRDLRQRAWMGHCIVGGKILYDPQHFLDFTQASVRGQFDRPDHVLERSRTLLEHARQMWLDFQSLPVDGPGPADLAKFLHVIEHAANAVAGLSGAPLTDRRLLRHFTARAAAVQRPGLAAGLLGLLGAPQVDVETLRNWLPAWQSDYHALPPAQTPVRLHPYRFLYYLRGIEALLDSPRPSDALWPLLRTWTFLANNLPSDAVKSPGWRQAAEHLGLLGAGFQTRSDALDAFLDTIDELLDTWSREHGA